MPYEFKFMPNLRSGLGRTLRTSASDSPTGHVVAGSSAINNGPYGTVFDPSLAGWDIDQSIRQGLERVIWVYRCVDAIASGQCTLPIIIRQGDPDEGQIVENKTVFKLLNRRCNLYERSAMMRYRLSAQLLLSKRGAFVEIEGSPTSPKYLHLLPPGKVEPVPDREKFVKNYRVLDENGNDTRKPLDPEQVIWIRIKPHPVDPFLQMTPMMAAGLAADTDWLARLFNRNILANDGRMGVLIAILGQIDTGVANELKAKFSGGPERAGRTTVIDGMDGIEVHDIAANGRDVQWMEAIKGSKDDILLAFGTPESVLGNASGRTFDNADAEKENWWEDTMVAHCSPLALSFDPLTGSIDDDQYTVMDYSKVDVLQRRKRARHDKLREEFTAGLITIDDYFEGTGRERWNVPGSRVLYLPTGVVVGRTPGDTDLVAQLPVVGVAQQAALSQGATQFSGYARQGAYLGIQQGSRELNNVLAARAYDLANAGKSKPSKEVEIKGDFIEGEVIDEGYVDPRAPFRYQYEGLFEGALDGWSEMQRRIIQSRLDMPKAKQHTRHWEGKGSGDKPIRVSQVVDTTRWSEQLREDMGRLMRRVVADQMKTAADEMSSIGVTTVMNKMGLGNPQGRSTVARVFGSRADAESRVSDLLKALEDMVTNAANNQSARVATKIRELDDAGASMTQIKRAVSDLIGTRSSWKQGLAKHLTTTLVEGVQHLTWSQAGNLVSGTWRTSEDEHVRATHKAVEGITRPLTKKFKVGRSWMRWPGDLAAPLEERMGCRCHLEFGINEAAGDRYDELAS